VSSGNAAVSRAAPGLSGSVAFRFVLVMGIVNLFADTTYEGGASINGPFMGLLGAGAAAVSIVAGVGEFFGYSLRSVFGYLSDRTGRYWLLTFAGYLINLLAVPAMALAGSWEVAAALIVTERIGRAMRKPTVEAMLSYTTGSLGRAWVYALNTALDETGATIGPLLAALVLFLGGNYRTAYALLIVSAVLALVTLTIARSNFPLPSSLEEGTTAPEKGLTAKYWLYMVAASCFAAGLMSFELIAYHLASARIVAPVWIPVFLALSTAFGVLASLALGRWYDRRGLPVLLGAIVCSAAFAPLVFLGGFWLALGGILLWGIGYATQDTLFKALIAGVLPEGKRSQAFGIFYSGYGAGWLLGSVVAGVLYERSRLALALFAVTVQLASLPIFIAAHRHKTAGQRA
jgi:MFS family permease